MELRQTAWRRRIIEGLFRGEYGVVVRGDADLRYDFILTAAEEEDGEIGV